jgi:predicted nuclease of restriction endonuclease-like (RecB) superfamily
MAQIQIQKLAKKKKEKKGEVVIAPITTIVEPEQVFKDTYNFDFLKLPEKYGEEDLKTALINTFSFKKRKPVLKEKQKFSRENLCNLWL